MKEKGSHGTSMTRALKIKGNGGLEGSPGLRGEGGYLWRKSKYYQRFAAAWYRYTHKSRSTYSADFDKNGAVVLIDFDCPDDHFLDVLNYELKERIEELASRLQTDGNHRMISKAYDFAYTQIEKISGKKIKLIRIEVTPPSTDYIKDFFDTKAFNTVPCLISRDNGIISGINILKVEDIKEP